jgi:hypothetical protein
MLSFVSYTKDNKYTESYGKNNTRTKTKDNIYTESYGKNNTRTKTKDKKYIQRVTGKTI